MLTISEIAVTAAIWSLTAVGGFFGTRAALRKKKLKCCDADSCTISIKWQKLFITFFK